MRHAVHWLLEIKVKIQGSLIIRPMKILLHTYLATYYNNFPTGPGYNNPNQRRRRLVIQFSPREKKIIKLDIMKFRTNEILKC